MIDEQQNCRRGNTTPGGWKLLRAVGGPSVAEAFREVNAHLHQLKPLPFHSSSSSNRYHFPSCTLIHIRPPRSVFTLPHNISECSLLALESQLDFPRVVTRTMSPSDHLLRLWPRVHPLSANSIPSTTETEFSVAISVAQTIRPSRSIQEETITRKKVF